MCIRDRGCGARLVGGRDPRAGRCPCGRAGSVDGRPDRATPGALRREGRHLRSAVRASAAPARGAVRSERGRRRPARVGLRHLGHRAVLAGRRRLPAAGGRRAGATASDTPMTADPGRRVPPRAPRAVDASMGLLNDVVSKALDPGYVEAAQRPVLQRGGADRATRTALHMILAVLLGLITVVAVSELRGPLLAGPSPRALLEREITDRSTEVEDLADSVERLSADIAQVQSLSLIHISEPTRL